MNSIEVTNQLSSGPEDLKKVANARDPKPLPKYMFLTFSFVTTEKVSPPKFCMCLLYIPSELYVQHIGLFLTELPFQRQNKIICIKRSRFPKSSIRLSQFRILSSTFLFQMSILIHVLKEQDMFNNHTNQRIR